MLLIKTQIYELFESKCSLKSSGRGCYSFLKTKGGQVREIRNPRLWNDLLEDIRPAQNRRQYIFIAHQAGNLSLAH